MNYRRIKGTNDYLPQQSLLIKSIESELYRIFEAYGYKWEITPILEPYELFVRSIGQSSDIVSKEMFIIDSSKNKIALKPEETAPLFRSVIENNYISDSSVKKLCYITPIFRHERPQKGRYREFYQYGIEAVNTDSPQRDAEIIEIGREIIRHFQLENIELNINSIGCRDCRSSYRETLVEYLRNVEGRLCGNCSKRIQTNPLRVFDCKNKTCINALKEAPEITDYLCETCSDHFEDVKNGLDERDIKFTVNPRIVRGLDYYSRTVFEFIERGDKLGAQSTVIAGGRYDYLGDEIAGREIRAVGFAGGLERLVMSLPPGVREKMLASKRTDIVIAYFDKKALKYARKTADILRKNNISVEIAYEFDKIGKQIQFASRIDARYVMIIGDNEIDTNQVTLKHLDSGSQQTIENTIEVIKEVINGE